jgi:hypothetical protein
MMQDINRISKLLKWKDDRTSKNLKKMWSV